MWKGLYQDRGHLGPAQVTAGQHEGPDATGNEGRKFRLPVADSRVLGDDRPPSPTDLGQPLLVACVLGEVGVVGVDFRSLGPERCCDGELAERAVDEEGW